MAVALGRIGGQGVSSSKGLSAAPGAPHAAEKDPVAPESGSPALCSKASE